MKYNFPNYKLKMEFTVGTWGELDWELGESACVDRYFYALPDGTEYAIYKFVERTRTGKKKCRWELWRDGDFCNNYFRSFDEPLERIEGYIAFWGFPKKREDYRVYPFI